MGIDCFLRKAKLYDYWSPVGAAAAVVHHDGIVNKFGGDSIMAVWNAPQSQPKHALLAVKAAWEAQQKLAGLQQKDARPLPVQFGIGVNTGVALAGNIGSAGRSEYTVIGDSVNTASRICSGCLAAESRLEPRRTGERRIT